MTLPTTNTRWTLVQEAKGNTPQAKAALSELCEIYYPPVLGQVLRWTGHEDDARELTQAFFANLLAGDQLNGANSAAGKFRAYLHGAVRHFLLAEKRTRTAERRGGTAIHVDASLAENVPDYAAPDAEFDRAWACAALNRTLTQLQCELEASGRGDTFAALKPWLAGDAQHGATLAVATQLGISETAVRVQVSRLRKRMRVILEQTLAETLAPGSDVREELRHLLAVFG